MGEGFKWKYRHTALAALFIVWLVSYMDRMVMATAIPYIAKEFSLTPVAVGGVLSAFFFGYASFQIIGGILADRYGARKVMTWAIVWWSAFTAFTGMVGSLVTMLWVRALFGMGEGVAPAATWKACAIWSPAKDRAWTSGLMLCSNCLGPALAPLFVAAVMATVGWRGVFYSLTIPGLLLAWWIWNNLPDNPADKKGITAEELEELKEDIPISAGAAKAPVTNLTFWQILRQEAVWKSFGILFFNNMVAWGFASWLPSFLVQARGLSLTQMGIAVSLPYFAGTIGWALGGWLSDGPFKNNRKIAVIGAQWLTAVGMYMIFNAQSLQSLVIWQTVTGFILYIAVGGVFSLPVSAINKEITGRAMGIVNTAGQVAGFLSPLIVGYLVQVSGGGAKSFDTAFMFFIGCVITSSLVCMTFPRRRTGEAEKASA